MKKVVNESLNEFNMGVPFSGVAGEIEDSFYHTENEDENECCDSDKEIVRKGILAELEAINQYEELASQATSEKIKRVFLNIAKEEKTHVGEFQALLIEIDPEFGEELQNGAEEIEN